MKFLQESRYRWVSFLYAGHRAIGSSGERRNPARPRCRRVGIWQELIWTRTLAGVTGVCNAGAIRMSWPGRVQNSEPSPIVTVLLPSE